MQPVRSAARRTADRILRSPRWERATLRSAARRRRAIVLLWHRVAPEGPAEHEVVPTVPLHRFHAQLDLVCELGDVVPLSSIDEAPADGAERPRFALTFDDDDRRHARHVLPALSERGLPATFFLSGRWLHGYGPYWWELVEQEVAEAGARSVARRFGLPPELTPPRLGHLLTGTPAAQELARRARQVTSAPMDGMDATALVAAGMEIGFHTIDHDALPVLDDAALREAVEAGREELAHAVGATVQRFAYPHGLSDQRVVAAAAGYRSGWTTSKVVTRPRDAPMLRGRWDLGHRRTDEIRAAILRGLVRWSA